jgi:hypothetical protein
MTKRASMRKVREGWVTPANIIAVVSLVVAVCLALFAGWQARRLAEDTGQFERGRGHLLLFGREPTVPQVDLVYEVPSDSGALAVGSLFFGVANSGERSLRNAYLVIRSGTISKLAVPDSFLQIAVQGPTRGREPSRTVQKSEAFTYVTHSLGDILPRTAVTLTEPIPLVPTELAVTPFDTLPLTINVRYAHTIKVTLIYDDAPPADLNLGVSAHPAPGAHRLEAEYLQEVYQQRERKIRDLPWFRRVLSRLSSPEPTAIIVRPRWEKGTSVPLYLGSDSVATSWIGWSRN